MSAKNDPEQAGPAGDISTGALKRSAYLKFVYSDRRRPPSKYNDELAAHLTETIYGRAGRLLDIGCGRGDMLRAFENAGHDVHGVDISPSVAELCRPFDVSVVDVERESLPYGADEFDFVFSKSVIEHMRNPLALLEAAYRVLKPGGVAAIMTPSWLHHGWGPFYLDFTHVTPFTAPSLGDAMHIAGFTRVEVRYFRQLPFLWKMPVMTLPIWLFSKLPLPYAPMNEMPAFWPQSINKLVRFSKEVMLIAVGQRDADQRNEA